MFSPKASGFPPASLRGFSAASSGKSLSKLTPAFQGVEGAAKNPSGLLGLSGYGLSNTVPL